MSFLLYQLWDTVLHLIFSALAIVVLRFGLGYIRDRLHQLSLRTRRRLPFGVAALLLGACSVAYARWGLARINAMVGGEMTKDIWQAMNAHLVQFYLLFAGFVLISAPAMFSAGISVQFRRASADRVLARDSRSPVLLLRSFTGDESSPSPTREIERALAKTLQRALGPLIALGSPKDFSPPWGARREYVEDEAWKTKVSDYLARATAVVFVVTRWTPSVQLEVELVRARFRPERTVLILPPGTGFIHAGGAGIFRSDSLPELLAGAGIKSARHSEKWTRADGGVVVGYRADWTPVVLKRDVKAPLEFAEITLSRITSTEPVSEANVAEG